MHRMWVWLLALVMVGAATLGCQGVFPRACLQAKDCERTPVNAPLILGSERAPR